MKRGEVRVTFKNGETFESVCRNVPMARLDYEAVLEDIAKADEDTFVHLVAKNKNWGYFARASEIATVEFKEVEE